jgi:hypothetical protein
VTARLVSHQPSSKRPPNNLNDGNLAGKLAASKRCSSSVSRETDARDQPTSSNDALIANSQLERPAQRGALRTEAVRFPPEGFDNQPPEGTETRSAGGRPTTRQLWELTAFIGDSLRPEGIDPTTGKRRRGPSVCGCGLGPRNSEGVHVHLRGSLSKPRASVSGVFRCDSHWLCPKCAPRAARARADRVQAVVRAVGKLGGCFVHVVLTVRHNKGHSIGELKTAVMTASKRARMGAPWQRIQDRMAAVGVLSAPEITWNAKCGWNFHVHLGLPCLSANEDAIESACEQFVMRYIAEIKKLGHDARWPAQFIEITQDAEAASEYITKGAAWEIAGGAGTKTATRKHDSLTPFQIAAAAAAGDSRMKALWLDYADAMAGTRACVVTKTMAAALGLDPAKEPDGEGEVEHTLEEVDELVDVLPVSDWNRIVQKRLAGTALGQLEALGAVAWPGIKAWVLAKSRESSRCLVDQIPYDEDSPIILSKPPPLTAAEIVAKLARQAREFVGGQKLIERELARLEIQHAKYGGPAPPTLADISRALSSINPALEYCGPLREAATTQILGAVARSECS